MTQINIDHLTESLHNIFFALLYIGAMLTALLIGNIKNRKLNKLVIETAERQAQTVQRQAFEIAAKGFLEKADYAKLKELALQREATHPADASAQYFLGMAYLRCDELVAAKRCFESAIKFDTNWRKVCAAHLDRIEVDLKKSKPTLVDNDR